jgi:hypothetical protein
VIKLIKCGMHLFISCIVVGVPQYGLGFKIVRLALHVRLTARNAALRRHVLCCSVYSVATDPWGSNDEVCCDPVCRHNKVWDQGISDLNVASTYFTSICLLFIYGFKVSSCLGC